MERVSNTLQHIMVEALKRLPAEQLPEASWDFAAGTVVAEKTRVLSFENQILVVEVADVSWRTSLYAMAPQFLARLNRILPIKRLEFKLARPQDEPRKRF
jgi:predicted nucleic acid-binding Zn ribbon protein